MENDYPASHSMDTCFFAVDRDGHVAVFSTGEAGAAPVKALAATESLDGNATDAELARLPRVEIVHDRRGRIAPGRPNDFEEHRGRTGLRYPSLVFLDSLDPVREEIVSGQAVEVRASEGVAVLFQEISEELAERLHESGACRGCSWLFGSEENSLAARGLFCYEHLSENWISGPYGRDRQPAQPIHVDQLSPRMRAIVQAMRFESLCFAETPHIQPVEHAECESWETAYLDVTGTRIGPIPGKENEYDGAYEYLAEELGEANMRVEPPPGRDANANES